MQRVTSMIVGAIFCSASLFTHAEVTTNTPASTTLAPASIEANNQPPKVPPANSSIYALYQKAAAGDANSQRNLGLAYANGTGVEKDNVEAFKWFRKAAEQGHALAEMNLALFYYQGWGVEKDNAQAFAWAYKSAEQGDDSGECFTGLLYESGEGVDKDMVQAAMWYRRSAEQGNATAQESLGHLYIRGLGVMVNDVEGLAWLYVASANGTETAANYLSAQQRNYSDATIAAARQRATELQAQIASHSVTEPGDSAGATQPSPAKAPMSMYDLGYFLGEMVAMAIPICFAFLLRGIFPKLGIIWCILGALLLFCVFSVIILIAIGSKVKAVKPQYHEITP